MEDKRKQDLEDEMNRFEQEIAGNLPPPPKAPTGSRGALPLMPNAPPGLPNMPMGLQNAFMQQGNMPFPGPPPPMPPSMFGRGPMEMMPSMPPIDMHAMRPMDGMHSMPPMPPGLPGGPPMMVPPQMMQPQMVPPQMMGMVPPSMAPGPSNTTKSSGRIAPPTVPLKNYEIDSTPEVEEEPDIPTNNEVAKETKQKKSKKKSVLRVAGGIVWEDETLMEWEMNDFRLFVGDLGNEVSDDALLRAFSRYPSLLKAKVIRDKKTKKTKGFGFVSFKDPQDYLKAMREMNGKYVGNRPIKLRKSSWKERNIGVAKKKEKEKKKLGLR